jgi:hypothetical protein
VSEKEVGRRGGGLVHREKEKEREEESGRGREKKKKRWTA